MKRESVCVRERERERGEERERKRERERERQRERQRERRKGTFRVAGLMIRWFQFYHNS